MDTLNEREKTHGDFAKVAHAAKGLKHTFQRGGRRFTDVQAEALDLIATKLARIVCGDPNVIDHWEDIAGYARLVVRDLQRQSVANMAGSDELNMAAQAQAYEARTKAAGVPLYDEKSPLGVVGQIWRVPT